ncbi:MAG: hypothetical protein HQL56_07065 [Magnetococcales bacterium]|nr:hypothetical protein [Magnetococcales bacterium]
MKTGRKAALFSMLLIPLFGVLPDGPEGIPWDVCRPALASEEESVRDMGLQNLYKRRNNVRALLQTYERLIQGQGLSSSQDPVVIHLHQGLEKVEKLFARSARDELSGLLAELHQMVKQALRDLRYDSAAGEHRQKVQESRTRHWKGNVSEKLTSAEALLAAYGRADAENQQDGNPVESVARIRARIDVARGLLAENKNREAREEATLAYFEARSLMRGRSSGDETAPRRNMSRPVRVTPAQQEEFMRRLASVRSLLAAHNRISLERGMSEQAMTIVAGVEALVERAQGLQVQGEIQEAKSRMTMAMDKLHQSLANMREGIEYRPMPPGEFPKAKWQREFDKRVASIQTLIERLERLHLEKRTKAAEELLEKVRRNVEEGRLLLDKEQLDEAMAQLHQGYMAIKLGLEQVRREDGPHGSPNFASREEMFHYQSDHNETIRLLMPLLQQWKEKEPMENLASRIEEARKWRQLAEEKAERGDFDGGLVLLEQSSEAYLQTIREAGVATSL